ncbi:MAG: MBOAT family protein [Lachnospiraceae bacterium]|nr:MBOAT family protein [Lachnospiraceae bacterium]
MIFSSLLFLFRFLPLMLLVYFAVPKKGRNAVLFLGSLLFYAWGEPVYVVLMLFSTAVDYIHGRIIESARAAGRERRAKRALLSSVVINLGLLGVFKYLDFLIASAGGLLGLSLKGFGLPLPIGISFYTFQTMSYSIDIYRGQARAQKNIIDFGAYVAMFPQLIAGPIVRYQTVAKELNERRESAEQFANGISLFLAGLGKKVLLANGIGLLWDTVAALPAARLTAATAWLGAAAFGLQIYFDFSGYSDMARGLGQMFGFSFPLNFDYPYISRSITEFWRRWHISLGTWFREYVYIPLGGNRRGLAKQLRNILVVWTLTGIWHGASWNFLLWGLYFGVLLAVEKVFLLKWLERAPGIVSRVYMLALVLISWVIFASVDGKGGIGYLRAMAGLGALPSGAAGMSAGALADPTTWYLLRNYGVLLAVCLLGATPLPKRIFSYLHTKAAGLADREEGAGEPAAAAGSAAWQLLWSGAGALLLLVCTAYLTDASYNPFLYFRF